MALPEAYICEELRNGVWHLNRGPSESGNADMHWAFVVGGGATSAHATCDCELTSGIEGDEFSNPDKWVASLR